jgi:hypothetical protein
MEMISARSNGLGDFDVRRLTPQKATTGTLAFLPRRMTSLISLPLQV